MNLMINSKSVFATYQDWL